MDTVTFWYKLGLGMPDVTSIFILIGVGFLTATFQKFDHRYAIPGCVAWLLALLTDGFRVFGNTIGDTFAGISFLGLCVCITAFVAVWFNKGGRNNEKAIGGEKEATRSTTADTAQPKEAHNPTSKQSS